MSSSHYRTVTAQETIAVTLHMALEHHERGELREASGLYREILGLDPDHADALFLLGTIAIADGEQAAAVQLLRAAVRNRPAAAHMHRSLADAFLTAGKASAALQCYWRILSLEPENPLAYVQVGDVLRIIKPAGGNNSLAASCYRRALTLGSDCATAHFGLGQIHRQAGLLRNAQTAFQAAIAADERRPDFHAALGEVLSASHQFAWSADAYRRAIQLKPYAPELLQRLGEALIQLGERERAEACYMRAAALVANAQRNGNAPAVARPADTNLLAWSRVTADARRLHEKSSHDSPEQDEGSHSANRANHSFMKTMARSEVQERSAEVEAERTA